MAKKKRTIEFGSMGIIPRRNISVHYHGQPNKELDEKIKKAMESVGAVWYAQGFDLTTGTRDIAFDIEQNAAMEKPREYASKQSI